MRFLVVDTETGGLDPKKHSLLSVAGVAYDTEEGIIYCDGAYVLADEYKVTPYALKLNRINLDDIDESNGLRPDGIRQMLEDLLERVLVGTERGHAFAVAGYNVPFDLGFLEQVGFFSKYEYRQHDVAQMARLMFVRKQQKMDLQSVASRLDIDRHMDTVPMSDRASLLCSGPHTCIYDAILTARLLDTITRRLCLA